MTVPSYEASPVILSEPTVKYCRSPEKYEVLGYRSHWHSTPYCMIIADFYCSVKEIYCHQDFQHVAHKFLIMSQHISSQIFTYIKILGNGLGNLRR